MSLDKILTHKERINAEKEATSREDINTPTQDEEWDALETQLNREKLVEEKRKKFAKIIKLQQTG